MDTFKAKLGKSQIIRVCTHKIVAYWIVPILLLVFVSGLVFVSLIFTCRLSPQALPVNFVVAFCSFIIVLIILGAALLIFHHRKRKERDELDALEKAMNKQDAARFNVINGYGFPAGPQARNRSPSPIFEASRRRAKGFQQGMPLRKPTPADIEGAQIPHPVRHGEELQNTATTATQEPRLGQKIHKATDWSAQQPGPRTAGVGQSGLSYPGHVMTEFPRLGTASRRSRSRGPGLPNPGRNDSPASSPDRRR